MQKLTLNTNTMNKAKIITKEVSENGNSYHIDFGDGMRQWFDTWRDSDGELTGDWNKYIFHTNNPQDIKEKAFQEANNEEAGAYNYSTALELCREAEGTQERLEYLRQELRAERISYGELAELQELIPHIDEGDTELLEAAGVPEFK